MAHARFFPENPLNSQPITPKKLLILIDFDGTIAADNIHNHIAAALNENRFTISSFEDPVCWEFIKPFCEGENARHHVIGSKEMWINLFTALTNFNLPVAIISFNAFPNTITQYLREIVGVPDAVLAKIFIYSKCPANLKTADKSEHIMKAAEYYGINLQTDLKILTDDGLRNLLSAQALGCETIMSEANGNHVPLLLKKIHSLLPELNAISPRVRSLIAP